MEIKLESKNDVHILALHGELDLYNAPKLKAISATLLEKNSAKVIIDMLAVEYIDSTGVGVILNIHTAAKKNGIAFYIINVHGTVEKVFRLTKLLGFLPIKNKLEDTN